MTDNWKVIMQSSQFTIEVVPDQTDLLTLQDDILEILARELTA